MEFSVLLKELLLCLRLTGLLFLLTLAGSLPFGFVVAFGRNSKNKFVSTVTKAYISVMRGTPLMLQLWFVFFGYPMFAMWLSSHFGFTYSVSRNWRLIAAVVAFIINYSAYFAEIYRSGIEAIPKGQYEAADVLGYSRSQTFFKIILPQVIKIVLPSVTNEVITLVKDTSLCYAIGLVEMFTRARQIATSTSSLMPFVLAGIIYYILNFIVAWIMERCEKKLDYYE